MTYRFRLTHPAVDFAFRCIDAHYLDACARFGAYLRHAYGIADADDGMTCDYDAANADDAAYYHFPDWRSWDRHPAWNAEAAS